MTEPLTRALTAFLATRGITAVEVEDVEASADYDRNATLDINYRDTEGIFCWLELESSSDIEALLTFLVAFRD